MKPRFILTMVLASFLMSCGSSKQQQTQSPYPNYGGYQPMGQQGYQPGYQGQPQAYQQQPQAYQQQPVQQEILDPTTMPSNISNCEKLALQGWMVNKIRGYGSAVSGNRDMARQRATISARNEIASTLKALVQSYMTDYNEDVEQNGVGDNAQAFRAIQEQVVKQTLTGTHIIFADASRNSKGQYFYEVCVELDNAAVQNALLSQSAKKGIKMDADKFREKAEKVWDRMAIEEAGYNPAVTNFEQEKQQKDLDFQRQQQNLNQQELDQRQQRLDQQQQQQNINLQKNMNQQQLNQQDY